MTARRNSRDASYGQSSMSTVLEMLANQKRKAPASEAATMELPVLKKRHEGACGAGCRCGDDREEGSCCG